MRANPAQRWDRDARWKAEARARRQQPVVEAAVALAESWGRAADSNGEGLEMKLALAVRAMQAEADRE